MNKVGYGDITPKNIYERTLAIIIIVFGCATFAYTLDTIGTLMRER